MGRAAVLCALGGVTLRLIWSGGFGWFVQQRMRLPLLAAGIILLAMGLFEAWAAGREEKADPSSIRRSVAPSIGWMLVLPLLVLMAVAPTGLGAAAAGRVDAYTPSAASQAYDPLPQTDGPTPLRVFDFLDRAIWDPDRSLEDTPILLEGLVVNDPDTPDGFLLTRFMVSCCAADGIPLQVQVSGAGQAFADDTWVKAVVLWRPPETPYQDKQGDWTVAADIVSIEVAETPGDAYESPY